jgi:Chaperone of endosialidase
MGLQALEHNTTGAENTALGVEAGRDQTTGSGNVYIGRSMVGMAGESNKTYIRNINTTNVSGGVADSVTVDLGTGLLGHLTSSRRYKEDIQPMDKASEALYRLKPVTYRYKKEIDRTQSPAFGLIAEQVADVNPDLVARNSQGQPESVHYEMVNAMLLNEFLKEHRKNEEQEATIARQQKQIEALAEGLQKVSAQLEVNKPAPQTVLNDH